MNPRSSPRRIAVIGNAGTGKSTLAVEIGRRLGLEVVHLDHWLWKPGWQIEDEATFRLRHSELVRRPEWVIEGIGYPSTLEERIVAADLVILTRYRLWRSYWWSLKRELRPGSAAGRPEGCPMLPAALKLVRAIWKTQRETLPQVERILEHKATQRVVVLRSPGELQNLLRQLSAC